MIDLTNFKQEIKNKCREMRVTFESKLGYDRNGYVTGMIWIKNSKEESFLKEILVNFNNKKTPFSVISTDMENGEMFGYGSYKNLGSAIRNVMKTNEIPKQIWK